MKGYLKTIAIGTFFVENGHVIEAYGIRKIESIVFSESPEIETMELAEIKRRIKLWKPGRSSWTDIGDALAPGKYRFTLSVVPVDMKASTGSAVFTLLDEVKDSPESETDN